VSDTIFSITGKINPINEYLKLAEQYDAYLWLDDAHGLGVLGENGRGTCEYLAISSDRVFYGGTLAKAFGGFGGIVLGSKKFIEYVRLSSPVIGGSHFNPAIASSLAGLNILQSNDEYKKQLTDNTIYFKAAIKTIGLETQDGGMPIISWVQGDSLNMQRIQKSLFEDGIAIQYCTYKGTSKEGCLRAVVNAKHTHEQIDTLIKALECLL